ncbi:MAG: type II toxin-antitoxin system HicB family antitoxin [Candidatus Dadabacteria bacterium]|nr:type II toxin-antitoxin system HicB family antitoxin [Candidatus Dadabacteria bacterium]
MSSQSQYTAIIRRDGKWWIGWIGEVSGVTCQESTREELLETLKITLREVLEIHRSNAIKSAGKEYEEVPITL